MLEVAFSRRMCCSRACRVSTKPRCPRRPPSAPTRRPGISRMSLLRQAKKPEVRPAEGQGMPSPCPSPTAMSAPVVARGSSSSPARWGRRRPRTRRARWLTRSTRPCRSSRQPKKLGCWTTTQAVRGRPASPPARLDAGDPVRQRSLRYVEVLGAEVGTHGTARYSGCTVPRRTHACRSRRVRSAAISDRLGQGRGAVVHGGVGHVHAGQLADQLWNSKMACSVPWLISGW